MSLPFRAIAPEREPASASSRTTSAQELLDLDPERLVNTYSDMILRLSYTYLHTTADAEDICQDVLLKLIRRKHPFRSLEHERAWIIRVTINACKDLLRRAAAHPQVALDDVAEPLSEPHVSEASAMSATARVLQAVMSLPADQRIAIYLHYYEGYSIRGIALVTGRSESAVAQHLSRGRKQLRPLLEGDLDEY